MSNPTAPHPGESHPHPRPSQPGQPGIVSDPDAPNAFGPDGPNVREDDQRGTPNTPLAQPPKLPTELLEDDDFAPDAD